MSNKRDLELLEDIEKAEMEAVGGPFVPPLRAAVEAGEVDPPSDEEEGSTSIALASLADNVPGTSETPSCRGIMSRGE